MKRRNIKIEKIIDFEDGSHYEGEVNAQGQPHGLGYMESPSPTGTGRKDRYEGEFKDGKKNGVGYMSYELNGATAEYEGEWRDDKRCGRGKYKYYTLGGGARHGYKYEGEWLDDKEHGYGISVNDDQRGPHLSTISEKYEGEFKDGKRNGHGKIEKDGYDGSFANGKIYFEGEFLDGKKSGKGKETLVNGNTYEGEFFSGLRHGFGTYTFANGMKFTALWDHDNLNFSTFELEGKRNEIVLMVSESHHGFGYSESISCLIIAKKGKQPYNKAVLFYNWDFHINSENANLEILDVTGDSVTYVVKNAFLEGNNDIVETIKRGETKNYKNEVEHTGRMYDEDFEYTSGSQLIISCK